MVNLRKITPLNNEFMEKIGFAWHTDNDNSSYIADEIVQVSEKRQMPTMRQQTSYMICM